MGLVSGDNSSLYSGGSNGSCILTLLIICRVVSGFIMIVLELLYR